MNNFGSSIDEIIRVNHAGEYSAVIIYNSQLKFSRNSETKKMLQHMLEQEENHLNYFENIIKTKKIRPTLLLPIWKLSAKLLGVTTALMGEKYVMLCTTAIEEVIDKHYEEQLDFLPDHDLKEKILSFREEELAHKNLASDNIKNLNFFDLCIKTSIKYACKIAIRIAKKI